MRRSFLNPPPDLQRRTGFTLVELLIVVGLLLLLAGMTVSAINLTVDGDKVRSGARQVQSYLEGARDRAIYSREPRGVRFLLNPNDPIPGNSRTVSSMVFIAPTENWSDGSIRLERLDDDSDNTGAPDHNPDNVADVSGSLATVVRGFIYVDRNGDNRDATGWCDLYKRKLLYDGVRIRIPSDSGTWYTIRTRLLQYADVEENTFGTRMANYPPRLELTLPYRESPTAVDPTEVIAFSPGPQSYELEVPPTVLPNQEPVLMPKGVVIHLDRSSDNVEQLAAGTPASNRGNKLPDSWKVASSDPSGFSYTSQMDVMFSPRGVVIGPAAQRGLIHFYIADQKDADRDRLEWQSPSSYPTSSVPEYDIRLSDQVRRGDKIITTLFTRTGAISTHQVHPDVDLTNPSAPPALREFERFRFAETGEVAGK